VYHKSIFIQQMKR